MTMRAKTFCEGIKKFNPYHDRLGRFTGPGGATSFTIRTKSGLWQNAADKSKERAKQQYAGTMPTAQQEKTLSGIENRTRNLKREQFRVVDREGNVVMEKRGGATSVSYTVGEARDNFPGNITIHNHPDGGTFSTADLSDFGYGATEMRAASPEGTYILRDTRHGQKYDAAKTKTWYDMRENLESAANGFKSSRELKKQVREKLSSETAEVDALAKKCVDLMQGGKYDSPEYKAAHREYLEKSDALIARVNESTRKAYTDQYHDWYKTHSMEYGLEYEFVPAKTRTKKALSEVGTMENVEKANDEIVLDQKMHDDIQEIVDSILQEILPALGTAKTFANRKAP